MLAGSGFLSCSSANSASQQNNKPDLSPPSSPLKQNAKSARNLTMIRSSRAGHIEPMGRSSLQPPPKSGAISALVISSTPSSVARKHHLSSAKNPYLTTSQRRWKCFRNICRTLFQIMFTQVGVSGLLIAYTIVGAFTFQTIELSNDKRNPDPFISCGSSRLTTSISDNSMPEKVLNLRSSTLEQVWRVTETYNIFNKTVWSIDVATALLHHQQDMVCLIQQGYEEQTMEERWSFPAALMFTLR